MKRKYVLVMAFLLFFAGFAQATPVYMEGLNDFAPESVSWYLSGGFEFTYGFSPDAAYDLAHVAFNVAGTGLFTVVLREDALSSPGAVLDTASIQLTPDDGLNFQSAAFQSPISLNPNNTYWIGFRSENVVQTYRGEDDLAVFAHDMLGFWKVKYDKPTVGIKFYSDDGEAPPIPNPEPATMLMLGAGMLGFAGLRRKFSKP